MLKKYWFVFAIVGAIILLWMLSKTASSSQEGGEQGGCKKLSPDEWNKKKAAIAKANGKDWAFAHLRMLEQGYCEHLD